MKKSFKNILKIASVVIITVVFVSCGPSHKDYGYTVEQLSPEERGEHFYTLNRSYVAWFDVTSDCVALEEYLNFLDRLSHPQSSSEKSEKYIKKCINNLRAFESVYNKVSKRKPLFVTAEELKVMKLLYVSTNMNLDSLKKKSLNEVVE